MKPEDMPAPDTLMEYEDGSITCAMFFYATEGCDFESIVREAGFKSICLEMEHDLPTDHPLYVEYFDKGEPINLAEWQPKCPEGWKLIAKNDSEDGPVVWFAKPLNADQPAEPAVAS